MDYKALLELAGCTSYGYPETEEAFRAALMDGSILKYRGIGTKNYKLLCRVMGLPEPYKIDKEWVTPAAIRQTGKKKLKKNVWGNWNGYLGRKKVMEFGTNEVKATDWLIMTDGQFNEAYPKANYNDGKLSLTIK